MRLGTWAVAFIIPALLVAAFAFFTFFRPEPNEDLEYLAREDAVLVQMANVGGLPQSELLDRVTLPAFTLYGDGTVIYADPSGEQELLEAAIPGEAVQDLLELFEGEGFFEFKYEQPRLGVYDFPTTYLYAQTKEAANAVSAYALGGVDPPDESEWREFGRLITIKERLETFDPEELGGRVIGPYEAEAVLLVVEPRPPPNMVGRPTRWPVPDVDLAAIAPVGSERVERVVEGEAARAIMETFASPPAGLPITFFQNGRFFDVAWRQALPFEEHFPEFDFAS